MAEKAKTQTTNPEALLASTRVELNRARESNKTMVPWWEATVSTLEKLINVLKETTADFDKMSAVLHTIYPDGIYLRHEDIENDVEFKKVMDSYKTDDPVMGQIIKASKESMEPIRIVLVRTRKNIEFIKQYIQPDIQPDQKSQELKTVKTEIASKQTDEQPPRYKTIQRMPICDGWFQLLIPDIPDDQYMINSHNLVVNRYTGQTVRPTRIHGKEYILFRDRNNPTCMPVQIEVSKLPNYRVTKDTTDRKVSLGKTEDGKLDDPEEDHTWIDWIPGIPKRKYRIYKDGRVFNTVDSKWQEVKKRGYVYLSASDIRSRISGSGHDSHNNTKSHHLCGALSIRNIVITV